MAEPEPEQVVPHDPEQERQRQRGADPETAPHVEVLGARPLLDGDHLGLERHAADRAVAGPDLLDLGMHRAGVDGVLGRLRGRGRLTGQVIVGCGREFARAAVRAEIEGAALMLALVLGGRRVHVHAADRILGRPVVGGRAPTVAGASVHVISP